MDLTDGTTPGLGRTGGTETGRDKRETTGVDTEQELDTTAGAAPGLETTEDTTTGLGTLEDTTTGQAAELDGATTVLEPARLPNGAGRDRTGAGLDVTATGLERADVTGGVTTRTGLTRAGLTRAGLLRTLREWTSAKLERAALTTAKPDVDAPNVRGTQEAIYTSYLLHFMHKHGGTES